MLGRVLKKRCTVGNCCDTAGPHGSQVRLRQKCQVPTTHSEAEHGVLRSEIQAGVAGLVKAHAAHDALCSVVSNNPRRMHMPRSATPMFSVTNWMLPRLNGRQPWQWQRPRRRPMRTPRCSRSYDGSRRSSSNIGFSAASGLRSHKWTWSFFFYFAWRSWLARS